METLSTMEKIPDEVRKQIEEAALKEEVYEPKYGGKDHSGYDTMMKYEINSERSECFEKGAEFGYSLASKALSDANKEIERLKGLIWRMYDGESLPDTKKQFKTENNL